jgi:SNF2 family DNA or RNA helicase
MQHRKYYVKSIKPEIIDWFLNRSLNNYDWIKDLSEEEVDQKIAALDPKPKFKIPLVLDQKRMFLIGTMEANFICWAGLGFGKSFSALSLIDYRHEKGKPSLVFTLDEVNTSNWLIECQKFIPHLKVVPILGTKEKRQKLINEPADLYLISYSGIRSLFSTGKSTNINPADVVQFAKRFKTIVYDEMPEVKNPQSISFQVCKLLSQNIPYRYGLTGRPFGRIQLDLWAQFYVIDLGISLGKNMETFKQAFFKPKVTPFTIIWTPNESRQIDLVRAVKNKSIYFPVAPLPPPIRVPIRIDLSDEAKVYYRKLRGDLINDFQREDWERHVKNPFIKFRQVCSGFLNVKNVETDPETGEEIVLGTDTFIFEDAKEVYLKKIISNLPEGKKMVIFYEFTSSGRKIDKILTDLRINHVWLWSGTKNKSAAINQFKTDPTCRILDANSESGGTGLNLQEAGCCYILYYENTEDPKIRAQTEGRVWRRNQKDQVYIYDLIIKDSIEERLLKFHLEGQQGYEKIVQGKASKQGIFANLKSKSAILNALGDLAK